VILNRLRLSAHPVAAQGGMGQWAWPRIAAVYMIVVTPGIVAFAFAQRLFFKG
jgi:ABC-type glycerol-3-phosphate transport system permease component